MLKEITLIQKLRGATASNHMSNDNSAVRAYVGTFEQQKANKLWHGRDKTFIEFYTRKPHRSGLTPGYAEWCDEQLSDNHLTIKIKKVVNGEGEVIDV